MDHSFLSSIQLDAFVAVARLGSFSKAAKHLRVTQSALSQRISNLEGELGASLFLREKKNILITEIGKKLLRYCQSRNDLETEFREELKHTPGLGGVVRIAGFSSITRSLMLPAIAPLIRDNPSLHLELLSRELHEILNLLRYTHVDFAILDRPVDQANIESHFLGIEKNVEVASTMFESPDVYLDHDPKDETTINYFRLVKRDPRKLRRRYLDDVYGIIDGVRLGMGKAILPYHLINEYPDLKILNPKVELEVSIYLHYFRQPFYTELHKNVLKTILEYFAKSQK